MWTSALIYTSRGSKKTSPYGPDSILGLVLGSMGGRAPHLATGAMRCQRASVMWGGGTDRGAGGGGGTPAPHTCILPVDVVDNSEETMNEAINKRIPKLLF